MYAQNSKDLRSLESDGGKVYIMETRGGNPFMTTGEIAERWGIAPGTVRHYASEIEEIAGRTCDLKHLNGRYPSDSVIAIGKARRINEFVFADYYAHRAELRDPVRYKYVDEFSLAKWAALMGFYNRPIREWDDADAELPKPRRKRKPAAEPDPTAQLRDAIRVIVAAAASDA